MISQIFDDNYTMFYGLKSEKTKHGVTLIDERTGYGVIVPFTISDDVEMVRVIGEFKRILTQYNVGALR